MTDPRVERPLQLAVYAGDTTTFHALPPGAHLSIGRADGCDIRVADAAVSRRHAVLHVGPPLEVEDLGGANGTLLSHAGGGGGRPETVHLRRLSGERARLSVGDTINLGGALAVVRRAPVVRELGAGEDVVAIEPAMRAVYEQAARAAQSTLPVLVLGETGVGKDVLARAIHRMSPRAKKPMLALNCAALSETLLESELFGHEKGAFTGAVSARQGLIESADGGTLFLDEIGDMPLPTQVKFLRVIEQREVLRVGARSPRVVDVRFVAATNKDLEVASDEGTFRRDLYFRLNALILTVPPLRERRSEIPELARRFLEAAVRQLDLPSPPSLAPATLARLDAYPWPGNVRELKNVMERAAVMTTGASVLPEHLPPKVAGASSPSSPPRLAGGVGTPSDELERLKRDVDAAERRRIVDALARCDGNQTRAAELLGISRRTLINRLEAFGIDRPRKRPQDG